jgi:ComF family protein
MNLIKIFLDIFAPKYCFSCFKKGKYFCFEHLNVLNSFFCPVCNLRFPIVEIKKITCKNCRRKTYLDGIFSIFLLDENFEKLIYAYKYKYYYDLVNEFSEYLNNVLDEKFKYLFKNFIFVPIPSYRTKINERGFDHIKLILENSKFKYKEILKKIKNTKPQAKSNFKERKENLIGAFEINEKFKDEIKNLKTVVIFDDIKTTGSTLNEAAKVLKNNGIKNVFALTLAIKL